MRNLQTILVGVDFTPDNTALTFGTQVAIKQALGLAREVGAQVDFLHSTWRAAAPPRGSDGAAERARCLSEFVGAEAQGVRFGELDESEQKPVDAMILRVSAGRADLLVVAKRNQVAAKERRLGSVSMELVRHCPAPIWVIKPEHELHHRCVVAATDLSPVGDLATEYGAFMARADGCRLCVVHAWQLPLELQLQSARLGEKEAARRREALSNAALQHIRALPAIAQLGERAEVFLGCDAPSHAILELVNQVEPDLVVMGTVSRAGLVGAIVGNTAERLLQRLDCSLLTVRMHAASEEQSQPSDGQALEA